MLTSNPDKLREWQRRSQAKARSKKLTTGKQRQRAEKPATAPAMRRNKRLRAKRDPKLVVWSRAIHKRDVFCQWPACVYLGRAVTTDAHHKAPRSLRPDLKYELSNGILLCRHHHQYTHGAGKIEAIALGFLIEETYEKARKAA